MGGADEAYIEGMKLLSVVSARPNFVKLAAVHHAVVDAKDPSIEHVIVHTGQHYDPLFSDVFFEQLGVPMPEHNLGVHGGTREEVIARTEEEMAPLLEELSPDCVLVYGDVNGAVGAMQAAKKLGIRLAHVEAGLRSGDLSMPEEGNRIAIDEAADFLFCTEESGMEHLASEDAKGEKFLVGNTMIDTLIRMLPTIKKQKLPGGIPTRFAVATLHRPSNVDAKKALASVLEFLSEVSAHCPLILPVHHRLNAALDQFGLRASIPQSIMLLPPLPYLQFLHSIEKAQFILTDSGGIQEEATYLKKRCFTLRRNTERPSTIESGSNSLIDESNPTDRALVLDFAAHPEPPDVRIPPLWDGKAGERIVGILKQISPLPAGEG